jgi:hypothetical protein
MVTPAAVPFAARHRLPDREAELLAAVRRLRETNRDLRAEPTEARRENWRLLIRQVRLREQLRAAREGRA